MFSLHPKKEYYSEVERKVELVVKINVYHIFLKEESKLTELRLEKSILCEGTCRLVSPYWIHKIMIENFELHQRAEEYVYLISLDIKCRPLGIFELSHGSYNCSFLMPREVYIRALLSGAVAIVLAHNHPSGDTIPSDEDIHATERIGKAGKLLGVELLDHIIIGSDGYCSLKEMGVML